MKILVLSLLLAMSTVLPSFSDEPTIELPETLKTTYEDLVAAIKSGDSSTIKQYYLPFSIEITDQQRESFDETIASVRKDDDNCYLVRTTTTALWFVETKTMGWKLYRYLDKPIE